MPLIWGYVGQPGFNRPYYFGARVTTYIEAPTDGTYTFWFMVDDYAKVTLNGQVMGTATCCNTWSQYSMALKAGYHKLVVQYGQFNGYAQFTLQWDAGSGDVSARTVSGRWQSLVLSRPYGPARQQISPFSFHFHLGCGTCSQEAWGPAFAMAA